MINLSDHLKELISLPGLSAYEGPVRDVIAREWTPLVDEVTTSRLGSLHALRRGRGTEPRRRILLAAHMDAIGLMVTAVKDGFLHITEIGGLDPRILPGQPVIVHGRKPLPGIVIQPSPRLLPAEYEHSGIPLEHLLVDVGLRPAEVSELVRVGDLVSFSQQPLELAGGTLAGHSMDNRASVAAVSMCLQELQHVNHQWDVWAVATVQEEETLGGAATSSFDIRPDIAVAIDVTFAKGPGASDYRAFGLGKGVTLGWGPDVHPVLHNQIKDLAEKLDIPTAREVMPRHSGTDAYATQVTAEGIPSMVVSIPLRYMHTPVETVALKDIERAGHLLAEYIARLTEDTFNQLYREE